MNGYKRVYPELMFGNRNAAPLRNRCQSGFTLLELLIVVSIIAILVAIAVPTFLGAKKASEAATAQSNLRLGYQIVKEKLTTDQRAQSFAPTPPGELIPSMYNGGSPFPKSKFTDELNAEKAGITFTHAPSTKPSEISVFYPYKEPPPNGVVFWASVEAGDACYSTLSYDTPLWGAGKDIYYYSANGGCNNDWGIYGTAPGSTLLGSDVSWPTI